MGALYGQTIDVNSPFFRRLTNDQQILIQAAILRLSTKRGTYWDDDDYGYDLTDLVNEDLDETQLLAASGDIKNELEKDERVGVATVDLSIQQTDGGVQLIADISIDPADGASFQFTLSIDGVSVSLLTGGAE